MRKRRHTKESWGWVSDAVDAFLGKEPIATRVEFPKRRKRRTAGGLREFLGYLRRS